MGTKVTVKLPLTDVGGVAYTTGTVVKNIKTNMGIEMALKNARGILVFVSKFTS
jgi:hypothetical protein